MGIDFTHCNANWSYSGFHLFRQRLASEIGINIGEMAGFLVNGNPWDVIKDPIKDLLDHSDCEGYLTPRQCRKIYPRLLEFVKNWDDDDYDKQQAIELAKGMKKATFKLQKLKFI